MIAHCDRTNMNDNFTLMLTNIYVLVDALINSYKFLYFI